MCVIKTDRDGGRDGERGRGREKWQSRGIRTNKVQRGVQISVVCSRWGQGLVLFKYLNFVSQEKIMYRFKNSGGKEELIRWQEPTRITVDRLHE